MTHPSSSVFTERLRRSLSQPGMVWLQLGLTENVGSPGFECFRGRLNGFLRDSGISPLMAGEKLVLIGGRRPILPEDKSLVVRWLMQQPEVVLIAMHRESGLPRPRDWANRTNGLRHV